MKKGESYKYQNSCTINISDIRFRLVNMCFPKTISEMVEGAFKETDL